METIPGFSPVVGAGKRRDTHDGTAGLHIMNDNLPAFRFRLSVAQDEPPHSLPHGTAFETPYDTASLSVR